MCCNFLQNDYKEYYQKEECMKVFQKQDKSKTVVYVILRQHVRDGQGVLSRAPEKQRSFTVYDTTVDALEKVMKRAVKAEEA